jgi:hypothetical protein
MAAAGYDMIHMKLERLVQNLPVRPWSKIWSLISQPFFYRRPATYGISGAYFCRYYKEAPVLLRGVGSATSSAKFSKAQSSSPLFRRLRRQLRAMLRSKAEVNVSPARDPPLGLPNAQFPTAWPAAASRCRHKHSAATNEQMLVLWWSAET